MSRVGSIQNGQLRFGNAFRSTAGKELLPLIVPVRNDRNEIAGALIAEMDLGQVVNAVVEHEGFGETSEAHIAQPTAKGDAEFITLMRFARNAAFNKVVPSSKNLPINWSLESEQSRVVKSPDYRSIPSFLAIQTLPETGWGLVVKIDENEALAPVFEIRQLMLSVMAAFLAVFFLFTLLFLLPLAKRLQATARAAQHIATGNYQTQLSDHSKDELGDVGRSIDYLASNLDQERKKRREVESELRHMASHDGLTGLLNRKTLTAVLTERAEKVSHAPITLLFIDLDKFKPINDTYGHTAGDLVLTTIAKRLATAVGKQGMVARWGGDEFVIAIRQLNEVSAQGWVQKIQQTIRTPVDFKGTELTVDASIGTTASDTSTNIEEMITRADQKMYRNKSRKHTHNRAA